LEKLVRAVDGDDEYLSQEYQNMSRQKAVRREDFAQYLSTLFSSQNAPTRWDLEAMLKAYGEDGYGAEGGLDIVEFTRAFCKLREQRGISVRLYRPSRTPQDTRDHSTGRNDDRSVSNPLLPGQSAT